MAHHGTQWAQEYSSLGGTPESFTIDYDTLGFTNAIGGGAAQGPSAPYLAGLINTIAGKDQITAINDIQNDANLKPDITTIIPLIPLIQNLYNSRALDFIASKLPSAGQQHHLHGQDAGKVALIVGLLFDFKRAGDYEQANAAKWAQQNDPSQYTILSTGDILCSTYSRSIKQPCILRGIGGGGANGSAIALFRFPDGATRVPNSKSYDFIVEMITKMEEISSVWQSKKGKLLQTYLFLGQKLQHFATMAPQVQTWEKQELLSDNNNAIFIKRLTDAGNEARLTGGRLFPNALFSFLLKAKFHELASAFALSNDQLQQQQINLATGSNATTMDQVKNMCDYIIGLRQPLLQYMRSQQAGIKMQEGNNPTNDHVGQVAKEALAQFLNTPVAQQHSSTSTAAQQHQHSSTAAQHSTAAQQHSSTSTAAPAAQQHQHQHSSTAAQHTAQHSSSTATQAAQQHSTQQQQQADNFLRQ